MKKIVCSVSICFDAPTLPAHCEEVRRARLATGESIALTFLQEVPYSVNQ